MQITTAILAADAVDGTKLADNACDSEHYTDGSVDLVHLADNAVGTAKILDANVTIAKLSATGTADNTTFLRGDGAWVAFASQETDPTATSKAIPMAIALG